MLFGINQTPLFCIVVQKSVDVHNMHPLKVKESTEMKIPATPEAVKNFLEDAGLDFHKYDNFKCTQRKIIKPS